VVARERHFHGNQRGDDPSSTLERGMQRRAMLSEGSPAEHRPMVTAVTVRLCVTSRNIGPHSGETGLCGLLVISCVL
jgi:hypothetical protein